MKTREEIPSEDRWNVEALYPDLQTWETALKACIPPATSPPLWPEIDACKGTLDKGPESVRRLIEKTLKIDRELSKLYTYAHLRHDEDIVQSDFKNAYERILSAVHAFAHETAWIQSELLALPESLLNDYLHSPLLSDYRFYLEKMIRLKKHTLSRNEEELLALAGQPLQAAYKAFNAMNDADLKFEAVSDENGEIKPLSHATYGLYIRSQDRTLRKNAFIEYHKKYETYENTLCELLNGQIQNHWFQSKSRGYASCLEGALHPKNIEPSVYHALIKAVHERSNALHRYMHLRKKILGLDELHLYDTYVPLTPNLDLRIPYEEAEELILESVKPLGTEYQEILRKGLKQLRWVDRYENQNKRSGGYSSGCFDSMPYILMNYKNILRDAFTLAHEAGHSMHSYYTRHAQPYQYSDYPIFLAEVASTFNEDLLGRLLISRCKNPEEKIFLINQKIEDIRGTLFRQTMFAEFELLIHEFVEKGTPLTPRLLKQEYRRLNRHYFGPETIVDEEIDIEWARIPHFYYNFYVFQYATGISASLSLAEKVIRGTEKDRDAYLDFLKGGSSKYPIDMLKMAGIDMTSPAPVKAAIDTFDSLLTELENLLAIQRK